MVLAGVVRHGDGLRGEDEFADLAVFGIAVLAVVGAVCEVDLHVLQINEYGSAPAKLGFHAHVTLSFHL